LNLAENQDKEILHIKSTGRFIAGGFLLFGPANSWMAFIRFRISFTGCGTLLTPPKLDQRIGAGDH
jgi:hypothetical protein